MTNNKSKITLTIVDTIRKYRGVLESPRALSIDAIPLYIAIATTPRQVTLIYVMESAITVFGVCKIRNISGENMYPTILVTIAIDIRT